MCMIKHTKQILLVDDDGDDCLFFKDAVEELQLSVQLKILNDGEQLMHHLSKLTSDLPDAIFLDQNMPRKNGSECLSEIKGSDILLGIPIIIFSTSYDESVAKSLYEQGAHYFICKPSSFEEFKKVICLAFTKLQQNREQPELPNFFINKLISV